MRETRLQYLTKDEAAALILARPTALLPIGSTEQHGPTGLCGTDAICAATIAQRAGSEAGVLVLPTLAYTPAQFNAAFPGTISIRSRTLTALLTDIFAGVDNQGFRRLVIINAHGANRAAIDAAIHDYYADTDATVLRIETHNWWDLGDVARLRREFFGAGEGLHATPSEISITLAAARDPEIQAEIDHRPLDAEVIVKLSGDRHGPATEHKLAYPDGLVGSDPSLANARTGQQLIHAAVLGLAGLLDKRG